MDCNGKMGLFELMCLDLIYFLTASVSSFATWVAGKSLTTVRSPEAWAEVFFTAVDDIPSLCSWRLCYLP